MECVFGLVGDGFALIAADTSAVHSILVHKQNEDKIMILDSHKLMGASGESGDRVQFTEYIQKNVHLYQFRNGIPLTTPSTANFTRGELATALRKSMLINRGSSLGIPNGHNHGWHDCNTFDNGCKFGDVSNPTGLI